MLNNLAIRSIISLTPILVVFFCLVILNKSAKYTMLIAWFITSLLALFLWKINLMFLFAITIYGILLAVTIIVIIFGAVLLLNSLKEFNALKSLEYIFSEFTPYKCYQALLLGFGLSTFIEGAAGFGTPAALVAPLLVGIGFPPLLAVSVALVGHSIAVSFGAVGTPILGGLRAALDNTLVRAHLTKDFGQWLAQDVSFWNSVFLAISGLFVVPLAIIFLSLKYFQEYKYKYKIIGAGFLASFVFFSVQMMIAYFVGPELPSLGGGIAAMSLLVLMRGFFVANKARVANNTQHGKKLLFVILIYSLVVILLIITRLPMLPLKANLIKVTIEWNNIFGTFISWSWSFLYSPGIIPFFVASMLCWGIGRYKREQIFRIIKLTTQQVTPALVALGASIAMAQIMIYSDYNNIQQSGMITSIAEATLKLCGAFFPFVSPWIGALGAFMAGSNTASNILFAGYQFKVALGLQLSPTYIIALQSAGGALGNIIAIHNIIAASATVGALGAEGKVLRKTLPICILCLLLIGLVGVLLSLMTRTG